MNTTKPAVLLVFAVLAGIPVLSGCRQSSAEPVQAPVAPTDVKVTLPKRGPITRSVTLPGEVKPFQEATLYAKVGGYLKSINVDKGDAVKQGDLLAEVEVPELIAELARNKAQVTVADIDYKRLSESQKKASDLVMPQSVDDARGKLEVARANLEGTETLLNFARIIAPFSGVITKRFVDAGAFIPAATSGSTPQNAALLTLTDFNRVRLQIAVPEAEASLVTAGQPVSFTVEGLPGRTIEGKITRFSYALDPTTKTMLAEVDLANSNLQLRPGMYASVKIGIENKADALLVPVDAVITEKSGASAFVVTEGKVKKARVEPGFNDGVNVEILKGLSPDQQVVLVGKLALKDGQPVNISEAK